MVRFNLLTLLLILFIMLSCESKPENDIRINQIQVLGTHNSYKLKPHPELVRLLDQQMEGWSRNIDYEHRPLTEQLEEL